jgi:cysteine desulfurase / selenocysteine lyase
MFIKQYFPLLKNNPEIAYFDNAATTQTHEFVLDAMNKYYTEFRGSPGRGVYAMAEQSAIAIDVARQQVAELINAPAEQLMFTTGSTQALNWIAEWNRSVDTVIITETEHNANIVPWLAQGRTVDNGRLVVLPVNESGQITDFEKVNQIFSQHPGSLLSMCVTSNVTGCTLPWEHLAILAHDHGISVCLDACQTVAMHQIDLQVQPVEWLVFSGHKMYGPTGVGALYTAFDLDQIKSMYYGGGAVKDVTFNSVVFETGISKHQAGTPNTASIIGMGVAAELIKFYGYPDIQRDIYECNSTIKQAGLWDIPGLDMITPATNLHKDIHSFVPKKGHSSDIAELLRTTGVALRTGRVCAHPYVDRLTNGRGIVRISVAPYNTQSDCETLVSELSKAMEILK